jgi:hypothetical protein
MTENNTQIPRKRSGGARIVLLVSAALASVMAVGALALGALALWGESEKDESGYLSTDNQSFAAATHAIATDNLDIGLDGAEALVDSAGLGDIRLDVESQSGKSLFVGIARTERVSSYLSDVSHSILTDVDYGPFEAFYSRQAGERSPAAPGGERIWAASTQGAGRQTLTWDVEDGDWSIVVMNADGSPGVHADISTGAKLPYLTKIGWSALGGGAILLLGAATLVVFAVRPPRNRPRRTPTTGLAPSAS